MIPAPTDPFSRALLSHDFSLFIWLSLTTFARDHSTLIEPCYPPPQVPKFEFQINHYAGGVIYNVSSFRDKNKDEVPKEAEALFNASSLNLIQVKC